MVLCLSHYLTIKQDKTDFKVQQIEIASLIILHSIKEAKDTFKRQHEEISWPLDLWQPLQYHWSTGRCAACHPGTTPSTALSLARQRILQIHPGKRSQKKHLYTKRKYQNAITVTCSNNNGKCHSAVRQKLGFTIKKNWTYLNQLIFVFVCLVKRPH